ncbi:MAG: hypothetical protein R3C44_12485 [Chloroflexota bacterium]
MNDEEFELGDIQGIKVTAGRSVGPTSLVLWVVFSLLGWRVWRLSPRKAIAGGLIVTGLHFLSELWHQLGHARAARRTGFPMSGIHFWGPLASSVYPPNEPPLPDDIHIARALGGPRASIMMTVLGSVLALLTWPLRSLVGMITTLFALDNLLVFTLGALLPLPGGMETDGRTILNHTRNRHHNIVIKE